MSNSFLSILMPALNEEESIISAITNTLKDLGDLKIDGEVIVINDGSSDRTLHLVRELISKGESRLRLFNHDVPQGIGASFWDGVDKARGEIVCMLPGDNENDPNEILRYLKLLDDVDMVVPFVYNKYVRSRIRNILSFMYKTVINCTFGASFNYTNGTVLYRKSILKDLSYRSHSFFFQTDVLIRLAKRGYLFAEVPYSLGLRKAGRSKAVSFLSLLQIFSGYLSLVRDIYFKNESKIRKYRFIKDSVSARRYKL